MSCARSERPTYLRSLRATSLDWERLRRPMPPCGARVQPAVCGKWARGGYSTGHDYVGETTHPRVAPILMNQPAMRLRIALALCFAACDGAEPPIPDSLTPPSKEDSSEYQVSGARAWYLVGDALTPGHDKLELAIKGPSSSSVVDLFLDGRHAKRAYRTSTGWKFSLDITALPPGEHTVLLAADGDNQAFGQVVFNRSHPLYVAVSNDWDTGDHGDDKLERQD